MIYHGLTLLTWFIVIVPMGGTVLMSAVSYWFFLRQPKRKGTV